MNYLLITWVTLHVLYLLLYVLLTKQTIKRIYPPQFWWLFFILALFFEEMVRDSLPQEYNHPLTIMHWSFLAMGYGFINIDQLMKKWNENHHFIMNTYQAILNTKEIQKIKKSIYHLATFQKYSPYMLGSKKFLFEEEVEVISSFVYLNSKKSLNDKKIQIHHSITNQDIMLSQPVFLPLIQWLYNEDSEIECSIHLRKEEENLLIEIIISNTTLNREEIMEFFKRNPNEYTFTKKRIFNLLFWTKIFVNIDVDRKKKIKILLVKKV